MRHASWLHTRFQPLQKGGETAFKRRYDGQLFQFSEPVLARLPYALDEPKLSQRWELGLWLGKVEVSDAHLIGTSKGILATRTVRAVDTDNIVDGAYAAMQWTPWVMRPGREPQLPHHRVSTTGATMSTESGGAQGATQPSIPITRSRISGKLKIPPQQLQPQQSQQ